MRIVDEQFVRFLAVSSITLCLSACALGPSGPSVPYSIQPLTAAEAETYLIRLQLFEDTLEERWRREFRRQYGDDAEVITVTGSRVRSSSPASITNNLVDGVDEGDFVKRIGEHLIVLRRGRLFSFGLGSAPGQVRALDYIDIEPGGPEHEFDTYSWYDEILVYDDTLILLGYSYAYEGSVIHRYRVREDGGFERLEAILLRSDDYFDSSNYATRIIGNRLVFYLPRPFLESSIGVDVHEIVSGNVQESRYSFEETVYTPIQKSDEPLRHSVLICPLDQADFTCSARSIVGPRASIFYISADAFYLWLDSVDWAYDFLAMSNARVRRLARRLDEDESDDDISVLYRIPIDGSPLEVLQARGWPVDYFSFDETPDGLRVFVWEPIDKPDDDDDGYDRDLYWLDIPRNRFSTVLTELPAEYRKPLNVVDDYVGDSRFIGPYLLYPEITYRRSRDGVDASRVWIKRLDRPDLPTAIEFDDGVVVRIEPLGKHAVVLVQRNDQLEASIISLGDYAQRGSTVTFPRSAQADWRSHGFNYVWNEGDGGVFALPVFHASDEESPRSLNRDDDPVVMEFVGVGADLGTFHSGRLRSDEALLEAEDNCVVSCTGWYGEARPIFVDDRVFALIDYELIEAAGSPFTVTEVGRANALSLLGD